MVRSLFNDKAYFRTLLTLALPIIIQNFITASMNIIDVAMIGQMGDNAVAAVGLSNQAFFIMTLFLFGVGTGSAIFTAQFWGRHDLVNVRKVLGLCVSISVTGALLFSVVAIFFPHAFLSIYTDKPEVIDFGVKYLRIVGFSYVMTAITYSFSSVLRSTEEVRLPVFVSGGAIILKTGLNYVLIFGLFGAPALGVEGAAIGTLIARLVECSVLLLLTYGLKKSAAAKLREMDGFRSGYLGKYIKLAMPVVFNEVAWAIGVSIYNVVYAHISTEAIAAMNIVSSIENLAFVLFMAISDATGIMIGNRIGAGEEQRAREYARRSLTLGVMGAILVGVGIFLNIDHILSIYNVSETARSYSHNVLMVMSCVLWVKVSNLLIIVGVLRAGGDTHFGVMLDISTVWLVGVPMSLIGGLVLHLPVYTVYLLIASEEAVKFMIGIQRFRSGKWLHNLIQNIAAPPMDAQALIESDGL